MGCRDCNATLEECQNQVAKLTEANARAATALVAVGGLLDEYEDEVRSIRAPSAEEALKKLSDCATSTVEKFHTIVEDWILAEEEARE